MKIESNCRHQVIVRLRSLREEVEQDGEKIVSLETCFALALSDVCDALGLTGEERELVLGPEAAAYVEALLNASVWTMEPIAAPAQAQVAPVPGSTGATALVPA